MFEQTEQARQETQRFMLGLMERNPGQKKFHQAVQEVIQSVMPYVLEHPEYLEEKILERITEPDRIVTFRVCWEDDEGQVQVNRAWRVQFNNAIGPYKGGIRFHPTVDLDVLKFLGFEQTFKNSLTTLPMGGAKGGSDFDPRGRSDREVMRFCQSLMIELHRHVGEDTDVPAGDIGVGQREISYMFGQYKRLANRWVGVLTGKGLSYGGSAVRTEATGYGCVYFVQNMLARLDQGIEGKRAVVSGAGNVALYTIEKLAELGATVVTASDSDGFIYDPDGIAGDKLEWLKNLKEVRRGRVHEYADEFGCEYHPSERPWGVPCDLAFPSATENEIELDDARQLVDNGVQLVAEGANMPTTIKAIHHFRDHDVLFAPAKAANAGGVSVSGLEQSQNAQRVSWSRDEVDRRLGNIMKDIHDKCVKYGMTGSGAVDYLRGANLGGFVKVAEAMLAYGVV